MKTQERKKEDCELIEMFANYFLNSGRVYLTRETVDQFKADNDLLPKPKIEFNRWIVDDVEPNWLMFVDSERGVRYGINTWGKWFYSFGDYISEQKSERYATKEEILERLSKIAEKMGYVKGAEVNCLIIHKKERLTGGFRVESGCLYAYSNSESADDTQIMKDGKWAKVIENTTEQQLQEIKEEVKAFKKRIEKKIKALNKNN